MDHDDPGSPPRLQITADCVVGLPKRSGGFGYTSPVSLAPCAYLASVRATQHHVIDPLLAKRPNQLALCTYSEPDYDALDLYLLLDCPLDAYISSMSTMQI